MFRKKLLTLGAAMLALCGATAAYADAPASPSPGEPTVLSGIYLGGYGGYSWTDPDASFGNNLDVDGGDYGVYGGYTLDTLLDRTIGLGINGSIEGHYGWSDADDHTRFDGIVAGIDKRHEWGVDFRPGVSFVDNALASFGVKPYGIIGYRRTDFKAHAFGFSTSDEYNGLELGLGTELIAFGNFGVRADYTHVFYSKRDGVDPDEDDLRVGIAYHFR